MRRVVVPIRNNRLACLEVNHIIYGAISQKNLHYVGHVNIGSFVAVTNFEEIFMRVLTNIVTGDLVLPQDGKGAGESHHQGEDDQRSPAHAFGYFDVETGQGGLPGQAGKRGKYTKQGARQTHHPCFFGATIRRHLSMMIRRRA